MNAFLAALTDPNVLGEAADVVGLIPLPEAPLAASGLRLLASLLRAKKTAEEIDAITARYSAEAQAVADSWGR